MSYLYTLLQHHQPGNGIDFSNVLAAALSAALFGWLISWINKKKEKKSERQNLAQDLNANVIISNDDYADLYVILTRECNPSAFINPYNPDKVQVANEIFSQLKYNADNIPGLIELRNHAIRKLGISVSTDTVFNKLCAAYNPKQYMGENYNADKLAIANQVYKQLLANKDNIIELEKIAKECGVLRISSSDNNPNPGQPDGLGIGEKASLLFVAVVGVLTVVLIIAKTFNSKESTTVHHTEERKEVFGSYLSAQHYYTISFEADFYEDYHLIEWNAPNGIVIVAGPEFGVHVNGGKSIAISTYYIRPQQDGLFILPKAKIEGTDYSVSASNVCAIEDSELLQELTGIEQKRRKE